jgi:hypothetical protein
MAAPVIVPELQFVDANGAPYAGGTLASYITGTSTPKATWLDPDQFGLNTNPIVLDAAGRCLCWGDGDYRLVLSDAAGNLIWDQPATTVVSAAMASVVSAPTIAEAVALLGINDLIAAETAARVAADGAEQSARIAADNAEATTRANADTAEANARIAGDANSHTEVVNEYNRAYAAEQALAAQIATAGVGDLSTFRTVTVTTDTLGNFSAAWSPAFTYAVKQYAGGQPFISVVSPRAVQAGAEFVSVTMFLDHCSGMLQNSDGLVPSPAITPAASVTFVFRVDGW